MTRRSTGPMPSWPRTTAAWSTPPGRGSPGTSRGSSGRCRMSGTASGAAGSSPRWRRCRPRRVRWSAEVAGQRAVPAAGRRRPGRGVRRGREGRAAAAAGRAVRAGHVGDGEDRPGHPRQGRPGAVLGAVAAHRQDRSTSGSPPRWCSSSSAGSWSRPTRARRAASRPTSATTRRRRSRSTCGPRPGAARQAARIGPACDAGHRRAAGRATRSTGCAPPRACSAWPTSTTRPGSRPPARGRIDRRGPVLPHHQGHPRRRHRDAARSRARRRRRRRAFLRGPAGRSATCIPLPGTATGAAAAPGHGDQPRRPPQPGQGRRHDRHHRHQRAAPRAAHPETVRHARHPRRPARPGPRRRTRPPGLPAGPLRGRDHPPRDHRPWPAGIRRARFEEQATLEGFDFTASPETARRRRSATSPPCAGCTPASRSSSTARSASARPTSPRPSATWPSAPAPRSGSPRPAGSWPTSPAATPTAPGTSGSRELTRPAVLILDDFAMRELTAAQADDLYELITERAGKSTDPDLQPGARRLVPAVPQPRRRRVPARPAHQHQPPGLHERAQLPPQQTTRARRPHREHERPAKIRTRPGPGELREHNPWGIT